ncbi:MAG: DUF5997 family protein [Microbacteriaceae bacterium]
MSKERTPQLMKPATAAQKLGVYLPATPTDFQENSISRSELDALASNPPAWLSELRTEGPHPRSVIAGKLGVSNAGLARGGATEALTTAEIQALLQAPPQWLVQERATQAEVRAEKIRVKERDAERAIRAEADPSRYRPSSGGSGI